MLSNLSCVINRTLLPKQLSLSLHRNEHLNTIKFVRIYIIKSSHCSTPLGQLIFKH